MSERKNLTRVYCVQYGGVWSLKPEKFIEMCLDGFDTGTYLLDDYGNQLARFPYHSLYIFREDGTPKSYSPLRSDVAVYEPLDWDRKDFASNLEDLFDRYGLQDKFPREYLTLKEAVKDEEEYLAANAD